MLTVHKINAELRNRGVDSEIRIEGLFVNGSRVKNLQLAGSSVSGEIEGTQVEGETPIEFAKTIAER